jgi:hypothetical protein
MGLRLRTAVRDAHGNLAANGQVSFNDDVAILMAVMPLIVMPGLETVISCSLLSS